MYTHILIAYCYFGSLIPREAIVMRWKWCVAPLAALVLVGAGAVPVPASASGDARPSSAASGLVADGVPGAVAVAEHDGRTVRAAAGLADVATGQAMTAGARFRVASLTKTFVATVVLQLVAEDRLGLDQPLAGLLPEPIPDAAHITVRELLDHSSGLFDYSFAPGFDPGATYTPAQLIALGVAQTPYFAPGAGFHYSSTNYIVLGEIVHQLTGRPIATVVTERLIVPLGLAGTTFPTTAMIAPGQAHGYEFAAPLPPRSGPPIDVTTQTSASAAGAAAAMVSTGADVDRFLGALLGGWLLPRNLLAAMEQPTPGSAAFFDAEGAPGLTYGLGLIMAATPCGTAYASIGDIGGYLSIVMQRGDRRIVLLLNTDSLQLSLYGQVLAIAEQYVCPS